MQFDQLLPGARSRAAAGKLGHGCLARGDVREVENVATSHGGAAALPNRKKTSQKQKIWAKLRVSFFCGQTKKKKQRSWMMEVVFCLCFFFQKVGKVECYLGRGGLI